MVLLLCISIIVLNICTIFCGTIFSGFKVTEQTITNLQNSVKNVVELWFLIAAHCLIVLYICTKFHENTS